MSTRCQPCCGLSIEHLIDLAKTQYGGFTFPDKAYYAHQASFDDLEASAENGCDLCRLIVDCYKGAPLDWYNWPSIWKGSGNDINDSMYMAIRELDATDVRIAIDSSHAFAGTDDLEDIRVFDSLMVQVGASSDSWEDYDRRRSNSSTYSLPTLRLTLSAKRDKAVFVDGIQVGRFELDPDLGSSFNFNIARQWLTECLSDHSECLSADAPALPARVIDVGIVPDHPTPRLITSNGLKAEYIALSHC
ncbi:hypothetical protein OQA88_9477 [Cercophora sp. LCS_1]